jgi:uncharacterized integral membrane protein
MLKGVTNKVKKARELNKKYYEEAKGGIKTGIKRYRSDPRLVALIAIEVILILMLIFALFFLFDPNMEFEFFAPLPKELKLVLFIISAFIVWRLYSYTEWYRKQGN